MSGLHVVFGAGQIGAGLAARLQAAGHSVRLVRRSTKPGPAGIEVRSGDLQDRAFAIAAAEGAAVIYHCTNPSAYTGAAWAKEGPALGEAAIAAASASGARLVVLDNLYPYGPSDSARTPSTPHQATGPKGRQRIAWFDRLRRAQREEGLRFVVGRAGDFFGPGTGEHSLLSMNALRGQAEGRTLWLIGDADAPHAFSYAPDVVEGLARLGEAEADVEGQAWHLPVVVASPRAVVGAVAAALGVPARARALPAWLVRAVSPVVPLFGELRETLYQWEGPFLVDDSGFRARFPGVGRELTACAAEIAAA